ncbi:MAG: hypothetical protein ACRELD_01580 [Longimicrobiales bacterium]
MQSTTDPEDRGPAARWYYGALALWVFFAGVIVVPFFLLLHSRIDHVLAVVLATAAGVVLSAYGYSWTTADASRLRAAVAGALGGAIGLAALHLVPLFH